MMDEWSSTWPKDSPPFRLFNYWVCTTYVDMTIKLKITINITICSDTKYLTKYVPMNVKTQPKLVKQSGQVHVKVVPLKYV